MTWKDDIKGVPDIIEREKNLLTHIVSFLQEEASHDRSRDEAEEAAEDTEDTVEDEEDYFDRIVGEIEDVIIDERFLQLQSGNGEHSVSLQKEPQ